MNNKSTNILVKINSLEEITMFEKVKNMLANDLQVNPDDIKPEAELVNDLGINSLELADLILLCEERYGIEVKDDDIHKFITVGDVVAYLEENNK